MDKGVWCAKVHVIAKRQIEGQHTHINALSNLNADSYFSESEACEYEYIMNISVYYCSFPLLFLNH